MNDDPLQKELRRFLSHLPDAPAPSNFTARVMQAIELEDAAHARPRKWNWHKFLPRLAFASVLLVGAGLTFHQYELREHRASLAKTVALVAKTEQMPSVEALKNFDAIQRMSQPHADEELLALLQ